MGDCSGSTFSRAPPASPRPTPPAPWVRDSARLLPAPQHAKHFRGRGGLLLPCPITCCYDVLECSRALSNPPPSRTTTQSFAPGPPLTLLRQDSPATLGYWLFTVSLLSSLLNRSIFWLSGFVVPHRRRPTMFSVHAQTKCNDRG